MQRTPAPSRRRATARSATPPGPPHLLYVEDNAETRVLMEYLLGETFEITVAPGGEEALRAIDSEKSFDLFLLDINLGRGPSGTELLRKIRDRKEFGEVPAIALTARAAPGDRQDLLEKGFDGYVAKPFAKEALTETIEKVLSETQTRGPRPSRSPYAD